MTYASSSASSTLPTSRAGAKSNPSQVFRGREKYARSTSRKREGHHCYLREMRRESIGMQALDEMFVTLRPKFVATARAILRNREDAEDAVQNAFLSAYLHFRGFEGRCALTTWFTRIVVNAALMIQRKRRLSRVTSFPETNTSSKARWMERIPASQPDPETVQAKRATFKVINEMLGKMKPALRQAFIMTYYDEMSNREASASLGVPTGTFKARLSRAKRYLADHVQHSLVAPIRTSLPSSFFPSVKNVFEPLAATADTSSLGVALP